MSKKKNNRKCIICGKEYSYCPVCGQDMKKPSWYTIFCGDNCNEIYNIVTTYRDGGCTLDAARDMLNGMDLSVVDDEAFNATTRKQIKEILGEAVAETVVEQPVEVVETIEETTPVVDETVVETVGKDNSEPRHEKNYYGKQNFYKKNK